MEKRVAELESENRKMREPLEAARREMEELRRRADNYDKMKSLYEVLKKNARIFQSKSISQSIF